MPSSLSLCPVLKFLLGCGLAQQINFLFSPEDRHASLVSLPSASVPLSPTSRGAPSLAHSFATKFFNHKPPQRPLSCVISDPNAPPLNRGSSRQIVVVQEGPSNLFRSSSTPKMYGASGRRREDPLWEVYQLEHRVPRFEPLAQWPGLRDCDLTPVG